MENKEIQTSSDDVKEVKLENKPEESVSRKKFKKKAMVKFVKANLRVIIISGIVLVILAAAYIFKGLFVVAVVDGEPISRFGGYPFC